ncbi:hypothetical protein DFJ63DRAFT_318904 [Scheffersomyces coipomensis]|uniref:uncharacterized protein n=1 Tax=Scheffersomyces coipomensis TaxID=1788519 RepID=UPI00315DD79A
MKKAEKFHIIDQDQHYQSARNQMILNQATAQLGISRFELRLLSFFNNYCIYLFSFGVNEPIHDVWSNHVPKLFFTSELVRNSIYSFSALNLFPLCDIEELQLQDNIDSRYQFDERIGQMSFNEKALRKGDDQSLFVKTTNYFIKAINDKNDVLSKESQYYGPYIADEQTAKELMISSILIFSFLGVHPHKIVPLVSFDREESDYLSISKGIHSTIASCAPAIINTEFRGLFNFENNQKSPKIKESTYPIIINLKRDLDEEFELRELDSKSADDYQIFSAALENLQRCLFNAISYDYPIPIFRWILLLPFGFHELVYQKDFFALRMLYIFASICTVTRFQLFRDSNVWIDYIFWYCEYNLTNFNNTWKYKMDENFYKLIFVKEYSFLNIPFSNLRDFDPDYLVQNM